MQNFAAKKTSTLEPLTENIIKKVTLRFFRHYYKFRLRYEDQPVVAKYDLEGVGGIIADGYYSFKKQDGRTFTATFEATSKATRHEVVYRPQKKVLFWDGLAVAAIAATIFTGINLYYKFHTLDNTQILERLLWLLGIMAVSYAVFYFIAKNFRRYRYIYAIEQFKKYHADEQWIALASNVFEDPNDKNLRELKNQCVFNGFGLVMIDENLDPKILITPSRQDIFLGKRQRVEFLPQGKMLDRMKNSKFGAWWGIFGNNIPAVLRPDSSIMRFRRTFYNQMTVAVSCLFLIGFVISRELKSTSFQAVSKEKFMEDVAKSRSGNQPEQEGYLDEATTTIQPQKQAPKDGYWMLGDSAIAEKPSQPEAPPPVLEEEMPSLGEEFVSKGGDGYFIYDCARFYNFEGKKYLIQEGSYDTWDGADRRLKLLGAAGLEPSALPRSCFTGNATGFIIFLGLIYNSEAEAQEQIDSWKKEGLSGAGELSSWQIRPIEHPAK